jgi:hypothetical protein
MYRISGDLKVATKKRQEVRHSIGLTKSPLAINIKGYEFSLQKLQLLQEAAEESI